MRGARAVQQARAASMPGDRPPGGLQSVLHPHARGGAAASWAAKMQARDEGGRVCPRGDPQPCPLLYCAGAPPPCVLPCSVVAPGAGPPVPHELWRVSSVLSEGRPAPTAKPLPAFCCTAPSPVGLRAAGRCRFNARRAVGPAGRVLARQLSRAPVSRLPAPGADARTRPCLPGGAEWPATLSPVMVPGRPLRAAAVTAPWTSSPS